MATYWTCKGCLGIYLDSQDCTRCDNPEELTVARDGDTELRLYCVMRTDLEIPVGKMLAQAGHAFVSTLFLSGEERGFDIVRQYMQNSQPKITLKAKNENALRRAEAECKNLGLTCYLVTDAGRTFFTEPTVTCLGIGPVQKIQLPKFVSKLQLFPHE